MVNTKKVTQLQGVKVQSNPYQGVLGTVRKQIAVKITRFAKKHIANGF